MADATVLVPNPATPGIGWHIHVEGEPVSVGDVRVVVDRDYPDAADIAAAVADMLPKVAPALLRPLREVVVARMGHPVGLAAASACRARGQVTYWQVLDPFSPSRSTLEHELAHLLYPDGGPPDQAEWRAAMAADKERGG